MRKSNTLATMTAAVTTAFLAGTAQSASLTWDITPGTVGAGDSAITGGTGAWNTTNGNWTTDAGVNNIAWVNQAGTPKDDATFGGTAGTVTLGEAISLRNLTFTNTAGTYTITGSTLNFTAGTIITNSVNGGTIIQSNITGAPAVNASALNTNEAFTFAPAAGGSMSIGAVSGAAGNSAGIINYQGGAGHTSTVASQTSSGPKTIFNSSGTWTVTGTMVSRNIEINGGTVIVSTGTLSNAASQSRAVFLSGGTLHYNNPAAVRDQNGSTGGTNTEGNDFVIAGGSIDQTSGAAITTSTWNPNMSWGGNWTFIGSNGANSNLNLGTGQVLLNATRQVTVTNAATTLTLGGVISGGGFGLTKAGAGTLLLGGANTYTGATAVNAGTLRVNGSLAAGSAVTVGALGTLSGTGTINGATTINGTHAPGNSPGIQTFAGGLSYASGSNLTWELIANATATRGTQFDGIDVTGGTLSIATGVISNLVFNGTGSAVNWANAFWDSNQTWLVYDNANAPTLSSGAIFDTINVSADSASQSFALTGGSFAWRLDGSDVYLDYIVPEPGTLILLGLGAAMIGLPRRKKAQTVKRGLTPLCFRLRCASRQKENGCDNI